MRRLYLAGELAALPGMNRPALIARWEALYRRAPPKSCSHSLLIRAIAYKLQERVYGGLSPATRRMLLGDTAAPPKRITRPGTVLLREWHGVTHQVTVIDKGVTYRGKLYRSLSQVAEVITGNHWSGPAFFGLKRR